jgi:hypothetical protein
MGLENNKRRIFFDMHLPDWPDTDIAHNFDTKAIAETFKKNAVDSVIAYAKCQYGNFYYDTELGHKHSGLHDIDFFGGMIKACHARNIDVIAYYSVSWDEYISERHPEWIVVDSNKRQDTEEFRWKTLCINSPYREIVKNHIKEIMTLVKPDGFWIDMTIIGSDKCYCDYCNAKFKAVYGDDIPKPGQENYAQFREFRYDYIEEFYRELRSLVKSMDERVEMCNNYWGYPYSKSTMGSRTVGALKSADFVTGEAYTDWTGLNAPSFFTKFLRGVSKGRAYEALIGRFFNTWDYTAKPTEQLAFEAYTTVANGACVTIDDEPYHDGRIDEALYQDIGQIFTNIKKRQDYLGGDHYKYAAILHSQLTKDYYKGAKEETFIKSMAGSFKMLRDLHLPCDFIFDENIETEVLSDYRVIIMPSVAVVDKKTMSCLKDYVKKGGTLLISGVSALYRVEENQIVEDYKLLNNYFDLSIEGLGKYSLSYLKGYNMPRVSLVKGQYVKYLEEVAIGNLVEPICETTKETFYHNNLPAPYKEIQAPASFKKVMGKGQILVFAQPIFTHYAMQSQGELRRIVKTELDESIGKFEIELRGPNRLDIDIWIKGTQTIVHLLNPNPAMTVCCGYMDTFENAYPRTFEYMDEVIPVYNIEIVIKGHIEKEQVKLLDGSSTFDIREDGENSVIRIESLHLWETLVIENKKEV